MRKERLATQMKSQHTQIQDLEMSNKRFRSPEHTFVQMYYYTYVNRFNIAIA